MGDIIRTHDIEDMLTTTYDKVAVDIVDLSQEQTDYLVFPYMMTRKGGMREVGGGIGLAQTLMVNHGGRSRFVGEYDEEDVIVIDHLDKMRIDFAILNDAVAYTLGELKDNRGEERIHNVIAPKKRALYLRVIETCEEQFFATPSPDNDKVPWGLYYWVVKNASTGFYGGYPAGFSSLAGLDLSKVPQMKNYTGKYTSVSKTDLITKMRKAWKRTNWRSPRPESGFTGDTSRNRRIIFVGLNVGDELETIGEAQNENLGRDLAPMTMMTPSGIRFRDNGDMMFRRAPIVEVEKLDDDSSDPVFGVDLSTFYALVKKGENMVQYPFERAPLQPRLFVSQLYHRYAFICINRRANWVLSK